MVHADDFTGRVHFPTHEFAPFRGGIAVYIEEMAHACAAGGSRPVVWAPDYGKIASQNGPVRIIRIPMRGKQDWICRWRMGSALARALGRQPFMGTIVLAEPGPIRWWMYAMLTRPPRPERLVVILHGSELKQLSANPVHKVLLGRLLEKAACIGVVSDAVRQIAVNRFPFIEPRVRVVPGAIRGSMLQLEAPDRTARKPEILHVGRVHPRKGQLELVQAFGRLPEALRSSYCLRLLGPHSKPAYADKVRQTARELSISLEMPGEITQQQLVQAYCQAKVFAMPSRNYKSSVEGLGLALLEAQFLGCPVVASDVGGVREAMQPGVTGILVPPNDLLKLADALQDLLEDPDKAAEYGKNGRRFVKEGFSWQRNAKALGLT